ncbi:S16 family serine protease [Sorangium sp. So ce590]|uniref:S16 family serine protease n=1 Tax=Sorangium sp. So ce590 TaxID=3133317 RepID=UPI003F5EEAEB
MLKFDHYSPERCSSPRDLGPRVRSDTAMTGECTLRGWVLPVGGIKAKVLAAHCAGLTRVVRPQKNARDAEEIPKEVRSELELIFVQDMSQVIAAALEGAPIEAAGAAANVTAAEPAAAA